MKRQGPRRADRVRGLTRLVSVLLLDWESTAALFLIILAATQPILPFHANSGAVERKDSEKRLGNERR